MQELRYVRAGDLIADERNFRIHTPRQREALEHSLESLGYIDAVVVRETPQGLVLVDGHLRADIDKDAQIPALVVDLSDDEAGIAMLSLDPIAAMAKTDRDKLRELVDALSYLEGFEPPVAQEDDSWDFTDEVEKIPVGNELPPIEIRIQCSADAHDQLRTALPAFLAQYEGARIIG